MLHRVFGLIVGISFHSFAVRIWHHFPSSHQPSMNFLALSSIASNSLSTSLGRSSPSFSVCPSVYLYRNTVRRNGSTARRLPSTTIATRNSPHATHLTTSPTPVFPNPTCKTRAGHMHTTRHLPHTVCHLHHTYNACITDKLYVYVLQ